MRKALGVAVLLCVAIFLCVTSAAAEEYGPIAIDQRPSLGAQKQGSYYEYRFAIRNTSAQQHSVGIDIKSLVFLGSSSGETHTVRQFTVGPRSTEVVSIPQYIAAPNAGTPDAVVAIDGREQSLHLTVTRASGFDWSNTRYVLVARHVPPSYVTALLPDSAAGIGVRADIPASEWSDQWIQYGRFDGALLTARDWGEMTPAVRNAFWRWVSAGGTVIFFGLPADLPEVRPAAGIQNVWGAYHGFGTIVIAGHSEELSESAVAELRMLLQRASGAPPSLDQVSSALPALEKTAIPVGSMFLVLIGFAFAGGPVSLFMLAKRDRRIWIFITLPLLAVATAVTVVGAVLANEGWVRIQKSSTVTLLDEARAEATTIGWAGFYSTFPPNAGVRFDPDSEVRPFFLPKDAVTDWTDGQRFVSGWIGSRVPSHFAFRKCESRRERVPLRVAGGRLYALNGLGVTIKDLLVAGDDGAIFRAQHIPAGKEMVLLPAGQRVDAAKDPALLYGPAAMWHSLYGRVSAEQRQFLQPGTYVAVLEGSPFVEKALARPTRSEAQSVVIGIAKRGPHAS